MKVLKYIKYSLFVIISIFFFISCSPVVYVDAFDDVERTPKQGEVRIFSNPQAVTYKYKEIGLITVDDGGSEKTEGELIDIAIDEAKELGADAIILLSQNNQTDGYVPMGNIPVAFNRKVVRASAIIMDEEAKDNVKTNSPIIINNISIADELAKLKKLKDEGVLTEEEFQKQKEKLLNK